MAMMMFSPLMLLLFLAGGENTLSGYLDQEAFWNAQGIEMEAEALRIVLSGQPQELDEKKVEALIGQLGDPVHAKRKAAMDALAEMGGPVRPFLEKAAKGEDPEVAARAKQILDAQPVVEADPALQRLMAIRGLVELGDKKSLDLLRKIAEEEEGPEARSAAMAVRTLSGDVSEARVLEPRDQLLARYPEVTFCLGQLRLRRFDSPLLPRLRRLNVVNDQVGNMLSAFGDVKVHRITGGLNQEVFEDDDLLVGMVYVELDYHSLSVAKWLMSTFQFQASQKGEMIFLHRNHFLVWPMSDEQLLLILHEGNEPDDRILTLVEGFREPRETLAVPKDLMEAVGEVPEEGVDLWVAGYLPEKAEIPLPEAKLFQRASAFMKMDEEAITMDAVALGTDAEVIAEHVAKRKAERDALVAQFGNRGGGAEAGVLNVIGKMNIEADGPKVQLQAKISMDLLLDLLSEFERFDVNMPRKRRMRHQRQIGFNSK